MRAQPGAPAGLGNIKRGQRGGTARPESGSGSTVKPTKKKKKKRSPGEPAKERLSGRKTSGTCTAVTSEGQEEKSNGEGRGCEGGGGGRAVA